jgi:hypothetical protein
MFLKEIEICKAMNTKTSMSLLAGKFGQIQCQSSSLLAYIKVFYGKLELFFNKHINIINQLNFKDYILFENNINILNSLPSIQSLQSSPSILSQKAVIPIQSTNLQMSAEILKLNESEKEVNINSVLQLQYFPKCKL